MINPIKVIRSYNGYARFLAECDQDDDGRAAIVREVPPIAGVPSPYNYSPAWPVHRWNGQDVVVKETAHRCYAVFAAPR